MYPTYNSKQINVDFWQNCAFCDKEIFRKKVLATEKIQYGGHFSRWPPSGPFLHGFAQKNGAKCNKTMLFGRKVHTRSLFQIEMETTKNQHAGHLKMAAT